jgi:NADH-quinone oxidoreductase subunit N
VNADYRGLLQALMPEVALTIGALAILAFDLTVARARSAAERTTLAATIGLLAIVAAGYHALTAGHSGLVFGGVLSLDALTTAARVGVLTLAGLTLALLPGLRPGRHAAEQVAITLLATAGFTLMAAASQLLVAFLALELASLSLYILAGSAKDRPESAEAALKYFLFGGVSAAFLLFGFSLIYGLTGALGFAEIAQQLRVQPLTPLLLIALVMILTAFGFKAAAAPFHLWAPDAYQGAPTASAALIASASKLAGFALFLRLLWTAAGPAAGSIASLQGSPGWLPVLVMLAGASLLLGNVAALAQSSVRRILAYSAIAHAGAMLIGVIIGGTAGPAPLFFYLTTYGLATIGAFGVCGVIERTGGCDALGDLVGLHRRSPFLATCLLVFMLSLAGIPPLAGFVGKFAVFAAAFRLHGLNGLAGWLALLAIVMSAVALYYYLLVLKHALVMKHAEAPAIAVPLSARLVLTAIAVALVVLGVAPSLLLGLRF